MRKDTPKVQEMSIPRSGIQLSVIACRSIDKADRVKLALKGSRC